MERWGHDHAGGVPFPPLDAPHVDGHSHDSVLQHPLRDEVAALLLLVLVYYRLLALSLQLHPLRWQRGRDVIFGLVVEADRSERVIMKKRLYY